MTRRRFLLFSAGAGAAALIGVLFRPGPAAVAGLAAFAAAAWAALRFLPFSARRGLSRYFAPFAVGLAVLSVWSALYTGLLSSSAARFAGEGEQTLRVEDFSSDGSFTARVVDGGRARFFLVRVSVYGRELSLGPGDVVRAPVRLRQPEDTGRFRAGTYYRADRIYLTGYVSGDLAVLSRGSPGPANWHKYLRRAALDRCGELFGGQSFLMRALLFGDKSGFSSAFSAAVSDAGVAHVFAVSGMHLSFLVSAVLMLSRRRASRAAAMVLILLFMAVTGFQPSVVRAGIMQLASLTAFLLGRDSDGLSAMMVSLLLLLFVNPCSAGDVGLQFSFVSVGGILLFGKPLEARLAAPLARLSGLPGRLARGLAAAVSVSAAALALTLPLTALYFERLPVLALVSNLAAVWLVPAVFVLGMLALLLSAPWLPLGAAAAVPVCFGARVLCRLIEWFASLPFSVLGARSPVVCAAIALVYLAAAAFLLFRVRRPLLLTAAAAAGTAVLALVLSGWLARGELRVSALDAGTGSCTLIQCGGETAAVDCSDADALLGALKVRNLRRVSLLVVTRPTAASAREIGTLLDAGVVGRVALAAYAADRSAADAVADRCLIRDVPCDRISADCAFPLGPARLSLMLPAAGGDERGAAAVLLECQGAAVFLTGGTDADGQRHLAETRALPALSAVLAGRGGRPAYTADELLDLARGGVLVLSGRPASGGSAGVLPASAEARDMAVFAVYERGDTDLIFRRGRILAR